MNTLKKLRDIKRTIGIENIEQRYKNVEKLIQQLKLYYKITKNKINCGMCAHWIRDKFRVHSGECSMVKSCGELGIGYRNGCKINCDRCKKIERVKKTIYLNMREFKFITNAHVCEHFKFGKDSGKYI